MTLDISFGAGRNETKWRNEYVEWPDFVDMLREVRRTKETIAEYDRMDTFAKGKVKNGPAFVGGLVKQGRRKKENVDTRSMLTLDADFANDDFMLDVGMTIGGMAYAVYSTHSHRPEKQKYRLIVPLSREVSTDEHSAIARKVAANIGLEYFDSSTFQPHRLMYLPSCSADAEPVLEIGDGEFLDADAVLAEYKNWKDASQWPRHKNDKVVENALKKAQDPHEKRGIIGLFCRAFGIETAIDAFLSDKYTKGSSATRYTYVGGTSADGLEIYPEQDLAFSHQDSDPISDGRTYNAFDIVRVHKFGHLDIDWAEGTKAPPPSVVAMETWAAKLPEIKKLLADERKAEFEEFQSEIDSDDMDEDWADKLELHHKTGEVLPTAKNVELILSCGDMHKIIAYDAFANVEVIRGDLPWRKREKIRQEYESWVGSDDARLRHWLGVKYGIRGQGLILDAFKEVANKNKFHPIKEFIESVEWDGVPRIDRLFVQYLGAEDTHYVRQVTRKMLLAAITRLYDPGAKFDEMLVLIGSQGAHKSSLIAKLGGRWFSDSLRNFDNKEAGEHLQNGWIFELSELSAMKKSELEEVKAFLSKTEDRYRVAYERTVSDFPRKCVFFGTTNTREFLKDKTGNRRFWPVQVDREKAELNHWEHLTEGGVKQIWAEALHYYKQGEGLRLDKEAADEAIRQQELHVEADTGLSGIIEEWLEEEDEFDGKKDKVCAVQIWVECLNGDRSRMTRRDSLDIMEAMRNLTGWAEKETKIRLPGYGPQKIFERKSSKNSGVPEE